MVWVTYHCPYCGAVTGVERDAYMNDKCVTREPLEGWTYAATTEDVEAADGIEFVCLGDGVGPETTDGPGPDSPRKPDGDGDDHGGADGGGADGGGGDDSADGNGGDDGSDIGGGADDPRVDKDGCGRTFYLNYVRYEAGSEVEHRTPDIDKPRFDFDA